MKKSKSPQELHGGCILLFGLPFLAAGLFISWFYFSGYSNWWQARSWEEVPCWIDSADLESSRSKDSTSYTAVATYHYEYAGKAYHGERVGLAKGSDNIGDFQQNAARELSLHVVGNSGTAEAADTASSAKPFRCYVNPDKPEQAVLYRNLRWQMQAFLAIFALTFPAVGAGIVAGGLISVKSTKQEAKRRASSPDEPWKWKSNWAGASIPDSTGGGWGAVHLYTLWAACVVAPLLVTTVMTGAFPAEKMSWLLLIFVAFWCLPAWFSLQRIRQRLAIGSARLELADIPARPGAVMRGAIVLEKPLPSRGTPKLILTCAKQTTRSTGKGSSISSETIWSHEEPVPQDRITRDLSGFRVPVEFTLPGDAPESGAGAEPSTKYNWNLQLKVPGTAIHPEFEFPVFRTGQSPQTPDIPTSFRGDAAAAN